MLCLSCHVVSCRACDMQGWWVDRAWTMGRLRLCTVCAWSWASAHRRRAQPRTPRQICLGRGPFLGHALQNAWDRPRSWDMPSKMLGHARTESCCQIHLPPASPLLIHTCSYSYGHPRNRILVSCVRACKSKNAQARR